VTRHLLRLGPGLGLALALLAVAPASAADVVGGIEVEGNARTSRDVILRALAVRPGDRVDDAALPRLRQRVLNLRVFRDVLVEKRGREGEIVLAVRVQERWTLVPIPIAGASDGAFRAGLAVLETNLLGRRKELAVVAIASSRGQLGAAFYRDPALLGTRALLDAEVVAENEVRERARGDDVVYRWRDRRLEASVRPGVQLGPRIALRAGPFLLLRSTAAEDGDPAPPGGGRDLGLAWDLEYAGQDYRDWFDAGLALRARGQSALPALGSGRRFTGGWARAAIAAPLLRDHASSAVVTGFATDGDPVLDAFRLGARPGTRGFREEALWAERAVTLTLDHQVPFWRPRWGTVAALGFVDAGVARWSAERTRWIAPGAGVRLYVRDVALPALGLDLAWSSEVRGVAASFFIGFGGS
jgi:outer membrane protein assembly factor BamA